LLARIIHDFDPFLWHIAGNFGIRWYSLPYLIGFFLAGWVLHGAIERGEIEGIDEDDLYSYLIYLILGVLVGARFFHVFVFEYSVYGFDPLAWIAVWRGGMAFHGGLVGMLVATWLFARDRDIGIYEILDRIAVPAAFALGLGRIANFINGEMPGTPWNGPFCVDYTQSRFLRDPPQGCRHPTQLYEMAKNWIIMGILWGEWRWIRPRPGATFWSFVSLYGLIRFFLMFIRDEARVWAGLTLSQIFSGLMCLAGLGVLGWLYRRELFGAGESGGS